MEMSAEYIKTERSKEMLSNIPLGHAAQAEEMDGASLLLASDAGTYRTGAEAIIDGDVGG